jgi:hypothetical protein
LHGEGNHVVSKRAVVLERPRFPCFVNDIEEGNDGGRANRFYLSVVAFLSVKESHALTLPLNKFRGFLGYACVKNRYVIA